MLKKSAWLLYLILTKISLQYAIVVRLYEHKNDVVNLTLEMIDPVSIWAVACPGW